jgi:LuxR family maltose regulon positive regulatory protein
VLRAIAAADLDALEELADEWWYELPARFGRELLDLLAGLPHAAVADRPRLLVAGLLAYQFVVEREDMGLRGTLQAFAEHGSRLQGKLAQFDRPSDVIAAGLLALISARMRGAYTLADRIGDWVERRTTRGDDGSPLPWSADRVSVRPGLVALHRGITSLLAGEPGRATDHFARAYAQAGPSPFQHFAGVAACANLALVAATHGHHGLAHQWLDRLAKAGRVPDWLEHYLLLGAWLAEAHLAIDRLDRPSAEQALARAGTGSDASELWPFAAAAQAAFTATFSNPVEGLVDLDAANLAHGIDSRPGPDLAGQLLRARADLLVAIGGDGNPVLALQDRGNPTSLASPVARVYLLAADADRALTVAERALGDLAVTPRDTADLQLLSAIAHLRRGEPDDARQAFTIALGLRGQGLLRPFAQVPAGDLHDLCRLTGTDPAVLAPALAAREPAPVSLLALTRTEQSVLDALATGASPTRIAHERGVSINTVRSQVKALYRKLGASNRSAALARARKLHIVPRG